MSLDWIRENPPYWDRHKAAILGAAPPGVFDFGAYREGDVLPGEWWRVEEGGAVLGYGWMDCTWGDAEILLAVDAAQRGRGVGTFILDHLEREARARGLNYLYNEVRPTHPDPKGITRWLEKRKFKRSPGDRLLRRPVHRGGSRSPGTPAFVADGSGRTVAF
jgi:GNAT superfamily N-acetyltransferase